MISSYSFVIIQADNSNCDAVEQCIKSIVAKSTYQNYEILVTCNCVTESEDLCNRFSGIYNNLKIVCCDKNQNYCAVNNYAVSFADGEYLLFLNGNSQICSDEFLQELLMYAQRQDVGAVGAKIFTKDDKVWHGGVVLGLGKDRAAGLSHEGADKTNTGYFGKMFYAQNVSAVVSDCLMVKKEHYISVGGFDEQQNLVYYDVDCCYLFNRLFKKG